MRMKLSSKGRFAQPPSLDAPLQRISEAVQSWHEIVSATHWHFSGNGEVDGADFYRGDEELGHLHLDGELHLVSTAALSAELVKRGLAQRSPWLSDDWVVFRIRSEADAKHAERLLRLAYDHLGGTPEAVLISSLPEGAA